jgi:hypothetical protein
MKVRDLIVTPCAVDVVRPFIEEHHYSKSINGVKITQCFQVTFNSGTVGAILFGQLSTTAWKKFATYEYEVLELRRLVLLDECPKNSESRVISLAIKWIKKHLKRVTVIVSYADPNHGHSGVIYKASNFHYMGKSAADTGFLNPENGKTYHSRALRTKYKGEYKPFVKKLRQLQVDGILQPICLEGKHCYVYQLSR